MYIEQVVEVSENKSASGDQQGPTDSAIDRRPTLVVADGGYARTRKLTVPTINDRSVLRENMDKRGKNSDASEATTFVIGKKKSSELLENAVEDVVTEMKNNNGEEEEDGYPKTGFLDDFKRVNDENKDDDDSVDGDNDEEGSSSSLFVNKMQSIFIRRSTIDCEGEAEATELRHPDKWIAKKGIGKGKRTRKLKKKHALSFFDTLLSLFVVAPLVIGQWRGIWGMMDIYKDHFPAWFCFIAGTGLHVVFAIVRDQLHGSVVEKWRTSNWVGRVAYDFIRLVYIYVFCVACNAHWRGGWMIFSEYFGSNIAVVSLFTTLFATALLILRTFRNLLAPPFIVVIDEPERVFNFPTRYNVNTRDWSLYILDCAFSVGVVGSLVVFVWRGVWVLFEIHLFPENREYSAIGSLIIGYIIVAVTFCLQPLMRYTCARLEGLPRLLAADAFLLLSFLGTVNVWRGIWTILDLWLLPDDIEMSCWITHVGCFVFLVLLNCSNSILVRGVYIDAEEEEGRCVVFPCHYLRLFFKIERQKKEARRQNLVAASKESQCRKEGNDTKEAENETLLNCANTMPTIIPANPDSLV